jgi:surface antigen
LRLAVVWLAACLAAGPAATQQGLFTEENIGKAVGAAAGALLGSQVGGGKGRLAAIAIGTLAGYWVGGEIGRRLTPSDRAGIATTTQDALQTGETRTWQNPDSGVYTRVEVEEAEPPAGYPYGGSRLDRVPPLELLNAYFTPESNINLRAGPGTEHAVLRTLPAGEPVPVVGRVAGTDWVMAAPGGVGGGFLYGPILHRSQRQPDSGNAIRHAMSTSAAGTAYAAYEPQCRRITQQVVLPGGKEDMHRLTACRQPDGSWAEI